MSTKQYTWAWQDTKAINIQKANSLKTIIHEVINQYFYDGYDDGGNEGIEIHLIGEQFKVSFTHQEGECYSYTIEATAEAATNLLDVLAKIKGRNDKFYISEA